MASATIADSGCDKKGNALWCININKDPLEETNQLMNNEMLVVQNKKWKNNKKWINNLK